MNPNTPDENNNPPVDGAAPEPIMPSETPEVESAYTPVEQPEAPVAEPEAPAPNPFFAEAPAATPVEVTPVELAVQPVSDTQAQPVAPAPIAETAPIDPTAPVAGAPVPPSKKSHKKVIIIASVAAGVVILAIVGVFIYLALTTVSKAEYRAAAQQFNQVSTANSALNSDVSSLSSSTGSTTDATFEKNVTEAKESLTKIGAANDELGKLKAVRTGEGAALYKTFNDKVTAYLDYADGLIVSVEGIRPALVSCRAVSSASDAAARVTALKACADSFGDVSELPNAQFKTFATELKTAYTDYAKTYEAMNALKSPFGADNAQYKVLREQLSATQDKISDASKTFSDGLKASDTEFSPKEAANALGDYLTEQQR